MQTQGFDTYMVRHALLRTACTATQLQQLCIESKYGGDGIEVEDLVRQPS